jgi:ABC-type transport system involved in cytochrome bd biosynthesis fused ATPase/permease subunit
VLSEDLLQGLDKATQNKYLDLIFSAQRTYTFIAVSHNVVMASRADLIVVMDEGKVVWQGPYEAFRVHPQHRNLI